MKIRLVFTALLVSLGVSAQNAPVKERVKAVRALAKQGSSAVPQIQVYLKDPETKVRLEAADALIVSGTQHSLDPLIEATRDNDPEVQQVATEGLVNFYLPGYVKRGLRKVSSSMRSQIDKENSDLVPPFVVVRPEVIAALGALARGGSSMESRAVAARAIGVLRGKEAVPDLLTALKSKDDAVIFESLIALQKIRDLSSGDGVVFLMRDLNERIRATAIETAGLLQAREAIPNLQTMWREDTTPRVRRALMTALALMPDASSRPIYASALADKHEKTRVAALEGYARLKDAQDQPVAKKAFDTERKNAPRLAAAFALVNMGDRNLGEFAPLPYIVNSLNTRALESAAEVYLLELARGAEVRSILHTHAKPDALKAEKTGVARVLGASGDEGSVAVLERLSKDADTEVAQEAINALRILRTRLLDAKS